MTANPDLVVIGRAPSTALAEHLQSLLAASGIDSFIDPYSADEVVAGEMYAEFTGVDVRVRTEDAFRARAVLDDAHKAGELLKQAGEDASFEAES
jgi:hypothetical protein